MDYDCVLLNLYPDGSSGMRYHHDPDQGSLWGYDTAVVSVGETRRFCFRPTPNTHSTEGEKGQGKGQGKDGRTHIYTVFDGDVVHMFGRCQEDYQVRLSLSLSLSLGAGTAMSAVCLQNMS